jgi:ADP-ribose pyrophosphatase
VSQEKMISSQLIYDGVFLKVHQDDVVLPNGKKTKREFIKHPGAALVVPVFDDFETMIVEQYRHPLKTVFIEFPAGKMDPGETPLTTAKRELLEETGLISKNWELMTSIHPVIGYSDEVIHLYLARQVQQSERIPQEGEDLILKKVSFQWLMQKLRKNELTDVKTQIALFWAEKLISGQWQANPKPI